MWVTWCDAVFQARLQREHQHSVEARGWGKPRDKDLECYTMPCIVQFKTSFCQVKRGGGRGDVIYKFFKYQNPFLCASVHMKCGYKQLLLSSVLNGGWKLFCEELAQQASYSELITIIVSWLVRTCLSVTSRVPAWCWTASTSDVLVKHSKTCLAVTFQVPTDGLVLKG